LLWTLEGHHEKKTVLVRQLAKVGWSSILVAALVLALGAMAQAQQAAKVPRVGFLGTAKRDEVYCLIFAFNAFLG
jgi:hypothetical protein